MDKRTAYVNPEWLERSFPCMMGCPVHTEAGTYVHLIAQGRYAETYKVARYELVSFPHENTEDWKRGTFSVTTLIRANVKAIIEYTQDLNESDNREFLVGGTIAF